MKVNLLLSFVLLQLILVTNLTAHSNLENLSEHEIVKIQKDLVSRGYLDEKQFKYGTVNFETDEAYDKFQAIAKFQARQSVSTSSKTTYQATTSTNYQNVSESQPSFLSWLITNLLSYLGF